MSARLEHGEKREFLEEAASRTYETPDGRCVRFAWRTLETLDRAGLVGADTPKATVVRLLRHVRSA